MKKQRLTKLAGEPSNDALDYSLRNSGSSMLYKTVKIVNVLVEVIEKLIAD